jgi:hypothetical protein
MFGKANRGHGFSMNECFKICHHFNAPFESFNSSPRVTNLWKRIELVQEKRLKKKAKVAQNFGDDSTFPMLVQSA